MPSAGPLERAAVSSVPAARGTACAGCGTELATTLLRCPVCRRLVHAETLARLAAEAETHEAAGRRDEALAVWRGALELLPGDAEQVEPIRRRIGALAGAEDATSKPAPDFTKRFGPVVGGLLLVLWKAKVLIVLRLTKAKFLLLG